MPKPASDVMKAFDSRTKKDWKDNFADHEPMDFTTNVPEGDYEIQLTTASMIKTQSGDPRVTFRFVITEGDEEGQQLQDRHDINEQGRRTIPLALNMLKGAITRMGYGDEPAESAQQFIKLLAKMEKEAPRYSIHFTPNDYEGNIRFLSRLDEDGAEVETDEVVDEEEVDEDFFEEGDEEESSEWGAGDWCVVNDPNDEEEEWVGEIVEVLNDQEATVKADEDGEDYTVRLEYLTEYEE